MRHALHSKLKGVAERVMPVLTESAFAERGVLTPEEFVRAGDFLVRTCPTWSWEAGDASKAKRYLPREKQYLVTRGVPSRRRASTVEGYGGAEGGVEEGLEGEDEGWVAPPPANDDGGAVAVVAADVDGDGEREVEGKDEATKNAPEEEPEEDEDDIPDLDDLEIVEEDDVDEASLPATSVAASAAARAAKEAATSSPSSRKNGSGDFDENVVRVRTYDLSISYDKYYQVPRFWLAGFDELRRPLSAEALLEDVAAEHARKTVTMEPHPHHSSSSPSNPDSSPSIRVASIHPCRHASVMKKLASMGVGGGGDATGTTAATATSSPSSSFEPEAYLVLFLKFISSVIPTIEYDFTMHAPLG